MKYLFLLLILLSSICSANYVNDLGKEFVIKSLVDGTYWEAGAWGNKNGLSNYYGNTYYMFDYSYYGYDYHLYRYNYYSYRTKENNLEIPEPNSLIILGIFSLVLRKKR
jgi:hypothetical protein